MNTSQVPDCETSNIIQEVQVHWTKLPLHNPYVTALGTLEFLDSVICMVRAGDKWAAGEACPVRGYNAETPEEVWALVCSTAASIKGETLLTGLRTIERTCKERPFARAALSNAIEQLYWPTPAAVTSQSIPLVGILNAREERESQEEVRSGLAAGFSTFKVKVGLDVSADITRIRHICSYLPAGVRLRLDANQQYNLEDATRLVNEVDPDRITLLEQPFAASDWELFARLAERSPLPLMADEAITCTDDIYKASDAGAEFVKLKLMKSGSCRDLANDIAAASNVGLEVIVGNGVASAVGCLPEVVTCINSGVRQAIESNGFLKLKESPFLETLAVTDGRVAVVDPHPVLVRDVIERWSHTAWTA